MLPLNENIRNSVVNVYFIWWKEWVVTIYVYIIYMLGIVIEQKILMDLCTAIL